MASGLGSARPFLGAFFMAKRGYSQVPNSVLEGLYLVNLTAYEARAYAFVLRMTFGWRKRVFFLNVTKAAAEIGIQRPHFKRALRSLAGRNMIALERNDKGRALVRVLPVSELWLLERAGQVAFNFEDVG